MGLQAFVSRRVATLGAIRPGAVLVRDGTIASFIAVDQIPTDAKVHDFGESAILPGLVDSHVHINDPGRTEWEGFETATRAAASGGYTMLVDMPLNCLPPTVTVAALAAKRQAAAGRCWVDWLAWGGVVSDNQGEIEALGAAGVPGFKCFLIHPGIDGFTMVTEAELRAALPHVARTGLPLLVHAERYRSAGSTSSACTLFISRRARRLRSCARRGRRGFRSVLRLVHTICISVRKKFRMGPHCVNARRRFARGTIAKSCGRV